MGVGAWPHTEQGGSAIPGFANNSCAAHSIDHRETELVEGCMVMRDYEGSQHLDLEYKISLYVHAG